MRNDGRSPGWNRAVGWNWINSSVGHSALCTVYHGYAVAGGHERVGGCLVYCAAAAGGHHRYFRQESVHTSFCEVEHVSAVAADIWCAAGDYPSEVVLGYYLDGEMPFKNVDVGIAAHGLDEAFLNLEAGVVGVVKYPELAVAAFFVEVEIAIGRLVEVNAPAYELPYLLGCAFHYHFHGLRRAQPAPAT